MNDNPLIDHLSAEQLQALLEGEVPKRDLIRVEEHLSGCPRCSADLEAWSLLFEDLGSLSSPAPAEDFAERVMAGIQVSEPLPLAARVMERLGFVTAQVAAHVATGVLQDFADGSLPLREAVGVKRHLDQCSACATEAVAWTNVMNRLQELDSFEPRPSFADCVMERVEIPVVLPLTARIRSRVSSLFGAPAAEHVPGGLLQDFAEGTLPGKAIAHIQEHVEGCGRCASEVDAWHGVLGRLEGLAAFSPSQGFADQVMARLQVAQPAPAVAARRRATARALAAAWRLVPQTREAWAALSGVAVTPAVITGLVFYAVFSHPTLTLGSLASFAWWQVTDLAAAGFAAFSGAAVQSAAVFGIYPLLETLAAAPLMVAIGVLAYSTVCALALRVLYKNLNPNRPVDGRYAHVTAS